MATLTQQMKEAITSVPTDKTPCLIGTVSADGWPNISYRGSVAVYSDDSLSFWNRQRKDTVANVEAHPQVVIFYTNRERMAQWRFLGRARVVDDPVERERILSITPQVELDADPELKGVGVIVELERILDYQNNDVSAGAPQAA
ncbi:MAG: pyridoxamine 5'-phosphate oxidase family protein [Dehalococcoidia bacterium]